MDTALCAQLRIQSLGFREMRDRIRAREQSNAQRLENVRRQIRMTSTPFLETNSLLMHEEQEYSIKLGIARRQLREVDRRIARIQSEIERVCAADAA